MASSSSSSSRTWVYDVFPSFSGEDVRKSFLSHFLEKLQGKSIITFIDNRIERSRLIELELLLAIRQSRISIVVFSNKYASSTWCLNELAEIHECREESDQMVIPIFYEVDPSHVRKQTGEFGKAFDKTCKGKTEDHIERWKKALVKVAGLAGYDSHNWTDDSKMIEIISKDVLNKLMLTQSDDFRDFVGIDAHVDAIMDSKLCLESGGVRMVGIVGPSGIGKTTIARALYSRLSSSKFEHRAFASYKRTMQDKKIADFGMKLSWAKHFLSEILCQKDIKIESLGMVEQRLKHRKVLIVLDDVDEIELLETLVGKVEWFGFGSRIVVVTQDRALLKSHEIDLIYEVQFPSEDLALQMFCQSAFGKASPPDGFMELAAEVANLSGNLPLGLNVLGSSIRKKNKEYWEKMMPRLRKGLNGKIEKTLRVSYDGLDEKDDQDIFVYIACLFNGESVNYIHNLLEKIFGTSFDNSLTTLADKSLVRIIRPHHIVQMHILLQKLGREIVRSESTNNPGKRRFLVDLKDISDVFENNTGTKNVLGIRLDTSEINEPLFIDDKSFEGMRNLQFINFFKELWSHKTGEVRFCLPHQGLTYFPRKLRLLHWDDYPAKYIPSNFKTEHLVELIMKDSKLEKLWEGAQPLQSLKKMNVAGSRDLKEIPDFSNATNLEILNFSRCTSLVTLPSSIRNLKKLIDLCMYGCSKLKVLPTDVNLECLDYLNLSECSRLRSFPRISRNISRLYLDGTAMEEEDCLWIENLSGLIELHWTNCPLRCMPPNFHPEHLTELRMGKSKLEKLWEGDKPLTNLKSMDISNCGSFKEIPDLSKAINLEKLDFSGCESLKEIPELPKATKLEELNLENCTSLKKLPDSVRNLEELTDLDMSGCTSLEDLPTNINLVSLTTLNLCGCSRLTSFPKLSTSIEVLDLSDTAIEEVPSWIENIIWLTHLEMRGCEKLKEISANIWNLKHLRCVGFTDCGGVTSVSDTSLVKTVAELHEEMYLSCSDSDSELLFHHRSSYTKLLFHNCFNLDQDAQKFILQSDFRYAILPGKKVPTYFTHRAPGSSLTVPLPQSSLSQNHLGFTTYIIPNPAATGFQYAYEKIIVHWKFRGVEGAHEVKLDMDSAKMDHLVVFHFYIFCQEDPPSQLDCENVEFEFKCHYTSGLSFQTSSFLPIKEWGVRVLDVFPSLDASDRSSEAEYTDQSEESGRSKKRMRMTVEPSQLHSNLPGDKTAVNSRSMAPCVEEEARSSEESGRSKKRMRDQHENEENSNSLSEVKLQ